MVRSSWTMDVFELPGEYGQTMGWGWARGSAQEQVSVPPGSSTASRVPWGAWAVLVSCV